MTKNNRCVDCNVLICNKSIRCRDCYFKFKKKHQVYKKYCCKDCGIKISIPTFLYGKGRCQLCSSKGINHPRLGVKLSIETKNKISQSLKGNYGGIKSHWYKDGRASSIYYCIVCKTNIISYQTWRRNKTCKNCSSKGELNPNYVHGECCSRYPNIFNKLFKEKIRNRDNHKCQLCGKKQRKRKLDVHHINYDKNNSNEDNLISLCHSCHSKTNGNRDYWYVHFTYLMENKNNTSLTSRYICGIL